MVIVDRKEVLRQLIHLSGIIYVLIPWPFPLSVVGIFLIATGAIAFVYSEFASRRNKLRKSLPKFLALLEELWYRFVVRYERADPRLLKGTTTFMLGTGLTMILFPPHIATLAVIALAVGDSLSTLVGIHTGKHKLPRFLSRNKSWEGTLTAFVSVFAVAYYFTTPELALITATLASLIEAFDTPIDDNLLIPLLTATVLLLIENAHLF